MGFIAVIALKYNNILLQEEKSYMKTAIDKLIEKSVIKDEVIVQCIHHTYKPKNFRVSLFPRNSRNKK